MAARVSGVVGLRNLGNSDGFNVAFQILSHLTPIRDLLSPGPVESDPPWSSKINFRNMLGSGGRLAEAFCSFIQNYYSSDLATITPRSLFECMKTLSPQFEDQPCRAVDILVSLLDILHEDFNMIIHKPFVEYPDAGGRPDEVVAEEYLALRRLRNMSPIDDAFTGLLRSQTSCSQCHRMTNVFDPFVSLTLPLPDATKDEVVKLADCFAEFSRIRNVPENEAYCVSCESHTASTMKKDIWKFPRYVIIELSRYSTQEGEEVTTKDSRFVSCPELIRMSQFALSSSQEFSEYRLVATGLHAGAAGGGHQYAHVLVDGPSPGDEKKWYCFNDSVAREIEAARVVSDALTEILVFEFRTEQE